MYTCCSLSESASAATHAYRRACRRLKRRIAHLRRIEPESCLRILIRYEGAAVFIATSIIDGLQKLIKPSTIRVKNVTRPVGYAGRVTTSEREVFIPSLKQDDNKDTSNSVQIQNRSS